MAEYPAASQPFGPHHECPRCNPQKAPNDARNDVDAIEPDMPDALPRDEQSVVLTAQQRKELDRWVLNENVNPKTGCRIAVGGGTHTRLKQEYERLAILSNPEALAAANIGRRAEWERAKAVAGEERARRQQTISAQNNEICERTSEINIIRGAWVARLRRCDPPSYVVCRACGEAPAHESEHVECMACTKILLQRGSLKSASKCACKASHRLSCQNCRWTMAKTLPKFYIGYAEFVDRVFAPEL